MKRRRSVHINELPWHNWSTAGNASKGRRQKYTRRKRQNRLSKAGATYSMQTPAATFQEPKYAGRTFYAAEYLCSPFEGDDFVSRKRPLENATIIITKKQKTSPKLISPAG